MLEIVAEKTGYPKDMLDLDLDLEADLGIDTVKQAEMFAAIRESYNIPRDENLKLRDFPTLAHVIRFAYEQASRPCGWLPSAALSQLPAGQACGRVQRCRVPAVAVQAPTEDPIKEKVLAIVAEKTGYPKDMLDLDLDLEADLGIDTVKQAEMFAAIRESYNIPRDENLKLRDFPTLAHVIRFAYDKRPDLARQRLPQLHSPRLHRLKWRPRPQQTPVAVQAPTDDALRRKCWRSWPRKPAIPRTCWTWILIWKRTSESTPSNRRRCSPPSRAATTFRATRTSSCATFPHWPT